MHAKVTYQTLDPVICCYTSKNFTHESLANVMVKSSLIPRPSPSFTLHACATVGRGPGNEARNS